MSKRLFCFVAVLLLGATSMSPAFADRVRYRGHVGVGVAVGPVWGPWYYPPPYYYPPYPPYPPTVIIERPAPPPVYIEQSPPAPARTDYWYYCQSRGGYYPYVKECPDCWLKVAPQP